MCWPSSRGERNGSSSPLALLVPSLSDELGLSSPAAASASAAACSAALASCTDSCPSAAAAPGMTLALSASCAGQEAQRGEAGSGWLVGGGRARERSPPGHAALEPCTCSAVTLASMPFSPWRSGCDQGMGLPSSTMLSARVAGRQGRRRRGGQAVAAGGGGGCPPVPRASPRLPQAPCPWHSPELPALAAAPARTFDVALRVQHAQPVGQQRVQLTRQRGAAADGHGRGRRGRRW